MTVSQQILFFGCGNMGSAMLTGWIASGTDPTTIMVIDPAAKGLPNGVRHLSDSGQLEQKVATVILAIKPQMLGAIADEVSAVLAPGALLISILAGTNCITLSRHFPYAKIVRLMPNLAAAIAKSPLGLWSPDLEQDERGAVEQLLAPLGTPVWLAAEDQMDAVTALVGSGPAFVYRFISALSQAGTNLGLAPAESAAMALAMTEGAVLLAARSDLDPLGLARRVTSPGGTTAAGLSVIDKDNTLQRLISETLTAARDRGAELAKGE